MSFIGTHVQGVRLNYPIFARVGVPWWWQRKNGQFGGSGALLVICHSGISWHPAWSYLI
jgi:hypothetical protein